MPLKDSAVIQFFDIADAVTRGVEIDEEIKALQTKLDYIKAELKKFASDNKLRKIEGDDGAVVTFSDTKVTLIDPLDYHHLCLDTQNEGTFYEGVKVQVRKAKDAFGALSIDAISKVEIKPYNVVSFKRKKK